jgi:ferrous-iron efflux pump FieF
VFVEFHLEVDGNLTIDEGHAVGDAAEASVKQSMRDSMTE